MNAKTFIPPPAVVLLSGGLDSATTLAFAKKGGQGQTAFACHTLAFDYGQRHRHELTAAALVAAAVGAASHTVMKLDLRAFGGSSLTADIDVPKDRSDAEMAHGIPTTYVPARNLVFLSLATAYAETLAARDIFIGVNAVDYSGYPDCRPEFIRSFEQAANLGTALGTPTLRGDSASGTPTLSGGSDDALANPTIRIHAPLMHLSKAEIIHLGVSLGVDYSLTHSCYDPIVRDHHVLACGHCDSCHLRREGFKAAGIADPTRYA